MNGLAKKPQSCFFFLPPIGATQSSAHRLKLLWPTQFFWLYPGINLPFSSAAEHHTFSPWSHWAATQCGTAAVCKHLPNPTVGLSPPRHKLLYCLWVTHAQKIPTCSSDSWNSCTVLGTWWGEFWLHCHWSDSWCIHCSSSTAPALPPAAGGKHRRIALITTQAHARALPCQESGFPKLWSNGPLLSPLSQAFSFLAPRATSLGFYSFLHLLWVPSPQWGPTGLWPCPSLGSLPMSLAFSCAFKHLPSTISLTLNTSPLYKSLPWASLILAQSQAPFPVLQAFAPTAFTPPVRLFLLPST